eukprot:TRINITY_DN550_c0_g1_i1.p1 TRINITY_DN550_c0_g1~~TRINITY_DN550_c0_g1_i1.p1  ORF type:complete len:848 (+),score=215.29 TRINITY_DN550_c0_g1_i1:43-2586(+)
MNRLAIAAMMMAGATATSEVDKILEPMWSQVKDTTECHFRLLSYQTSLKRLPALAPNVDVFDALDLMTMCQVTRPTPKTVPWPSFSTPSAAFYVDYEKGSDSNDGSQSRPFKTVGKAVTASRSSSTKTILLRKGIHFLPDTINLSQEDSGLTIQNYNGEEAWMSGGVELQTNWQEYNTRDGKNIWVTDIGNEIDDILGLMTVEPHTRQMRARYPNPPTGTQEIRPAAKVDGKAIKSWQAPKKLPPAEQVFVNATELSGFDSSILWQYNAYASGNCKKVNDPECPCGAWSDVKDGVWTSSSYWCSNRSAGGWSEMDRGNGYYNGPILPTGVTYDKTMLPNFQTYENATGAILVGWRAQGWFVNMYEVEKHDKEAGTFSWTKGGFQGGRGWQLNGTTGAIDPNPTFYIENVFEELDAPTEWFFNQNTRKLYLYYNATSGTAPPKDLQFVSTKLRRLIDISGKFGNPVKGVTVQGLGFRDTSYTYMAPWAAPSGGDWALHRGGAVFIERTEHTTVRNCLFRRVDGNAVMISGYNRYATMDGNEFNWIGDSAMAAWGYTKEHDGTDGDQPRYTQIVNNVCHELGIFQLQSSCWFQAKTALSNVTNNLFYNGPRAGINMNDGFGGGNTLSKNVIFNQCRQSGDHGPINSWDRQLFWTDVRDGADKPGWNPKYTDVSQNVIIANYGGSQGFDNDDGSSWYNIHHNVIYGEGLKQDYGGHDSKYENNLNLVHHYDGQNCLNTWPFKKGTPPCGDWSTEADCSHAHHFTNNKCIVLYTSVYSPGAGGCPPAFDSMTYLANNSYFTPNGTAYLQCSQTDYKSIPELQKIGTELGSSQALIPSSEEWLGWANTILDL